MLYGPTVLIPQLVAGFTQLPLTGSTLRRRWHLTLQCTPPDGSGKQSATAFRYKLSESIQI
jgi:hypothetical protein